MTRRSSESMIFMISPNKPKLPTDYCRDLFFSPCHRIVHPPPVLIAGFVTKHFFKLYQIYSAACLYVCTLRSSYYDVLRATFFFFGRSFMYDELNYGLYASATLTLFVVFYIVIVTSPVVLIKIWVIELRNSLGGVH